MLNKNKIELVCYCDDDIKYKLFNDVYVLTSPLKFIPYNCKFNKGQMKQLIDILLRGSQKLKITIEKVGE